MGRCHRPPPGRASGRPQVGDRSQEAYFLNQIGTMRHLLGEFGASKLVLQEALGIYTELADQLGRPTPSSSSGSSAGSPATTPNAVHALEAALGVYRALDDQRGQANALLELGACHAG